MLAAEMSANTAYAELISVHIDSKWAIYCSVISSVVLFAGYSRPSSGLPPLAMASAQHGQPSSTQAGELSSDHSTTIPRERTSRSLQVPCEKRLDVSVPGWGPVVKLKVREHVRDSHHITFQTEDPTKIHDLKIDFPSNSTTRVAILRKIGT
jgi:hypothetical protein